MSNNLSSKVTSLCILIFFPVIILLLDCSPLCVSLESSESDDEDEDEDDSMCFLLVLCCFESLLLSSSVSRFRLSFSLLSSICLSSLSSLSSSFSLSRFLCLESFVLCFPLFFFFLSDLCFLCFS